MTISSKYEWSKQRSIEMSNCLSYLPCVSSSLNLWFSIICVHFGLCSIPIWAYNTKKVTLYTNLIREALMCLYSIEHVYIYTAMLLWWALAWIHTHSNLNGVWVQIHSFHFWRFLYWKLNFNFWKLSVILCNIMWNFWASSPHHQHLELMTGLVCPAKESKSDLRRRPRARR